MHSHTSAGVGPRYRCPRGAHITRSATPIDALVLGVLRARLARPDLADLLATPDTAQAREAAQNIRQLRGRLVQTEADYDADLTDATRYKVKTSKIRAELATAVATQH